jgi:hypothetical protein
MEPPHLAARAPSGIVFRVLLDGAADIVGVAIWFN